MRPKARRAFQGERELAISVLNRTRALGAPRRRPAFRAFERWRRRSSRSVGLAWKAGERRGLWPAEGEPDRIVERAEFSTTTPRETLGDGSRLARRARRRAPVRRSRYRHLRSRRPGSHQLHVWLHHPLPQARVGGRERPRLPHRQPPPRPPPSVSTQTSTPPPWPSSPP